MESRREMSQSSRLEFLENFSANNSASNAEDSTLGMLDRGRSDLSF